MVIFSGPTRANAHCLIMLCLEFWTFASPYNWYKKKARAALKQKFPNKGICKMSKFLEQGAAPSPMVQTWGQASWVSQKTSSCSKPNRNNLKWILLYYLCNGSCPETNKPLSRLHPQVWERRRIDWMSNWIQWWSCGRCGTEDDK